MFRKISRIAVLAPLFCIAVVAEDAGAFLMDLSSGTSANPQVWQMPMVMYSPGSWTMMLMGQAFIGDTQQSGPRGGDKFYSPNAFMGTGGAQRGGKGRLRGATDAELGAGNHYQSEIPAAVSNRRDGVWVADC